MTSEEIQEEEVKQTKTERFATWLMERQEKKEEKETSLEALMKFNIFLSIGTLVAVAGSTAANYIMIAYTWL